MEFSEDQIAFFRADLESGMAYTKMIKAVRKKLEEEGRDFDKEFEVWKKRQTPPSIGRHLKTQKGGG
jgi:hypothetical protein